MGDPTSLDHKLAEVSQNIEKLRLETQKFEVGKSCCGKSFVGENKKKKDTEVGVGSRDDEVVERQHFFPVRDAAGKVRVFHEL